MKDFGKLAVCYYFPPTSLFFGPFRPDCTFFSVGDWRQNDMFMDIPKRILPSVYRTYFSIHITFHQVLLHQITFHVYINNCKASSGGAVTQLVGPQARDHWHWA